MCSGDLRVLPAPCILRLGTHTSISRGGNYLYNLRAPATHLAGWSRNLVMSRVRTSLEQVQALTTTCKHKPSLLCIVMKRTPTVTCQGSAYTERRAAKYSERRLAAVAGAAPGCFLAFRSCWHHPGQVTGAMTELSHHNNPAEGSHRSAPLAVAGEQAPRQITGSVPARFTMLLFFKCQRFFGFPTAFCGAPLNLIAQGH